MTSNNDFLPDSFDVPATGGNYMRLTQGENRFRVLSSAIAGFEYWTESPEGDRKPLRRPLTKPFETSEVANPSDIKRFLAFVVWNYKAEEVQILSVTQKSIQRSLKSLSSDPDWGKPFNYDLVITRKGDGLETEYTTMPKPAKELDPGIKDAYEKMGIKLEALYDGADPFAGSVSASESEQSEALAEDAHKAIG